MNVQSVRYLYNTLLLANPEDPGLSVRTLHDAPSHANLENQVIFLSFSTKWCSTTFFYRRAN